VLELDLLLNNYLIFNFTISNVSTLIGSSSVFDNNNLITKHKNYITPILLLCPQGQIFRYSVKILLCYRHGYNRVYSKLRFNL